MLPYNVCRAAPCRPPKEDFFGPCGEPEGFYCIIVSADFTLVKKILTLCAEQHESPAGTSCRMFEPPVGGQGKKLLLRVHAQVLTPPCGDHRVTSQCVQSSMRALQGPHAGFVLGPPVGGPGKNFCCVRMSRC